MCSTSSKCLICPFCLVCDWQSAVSRVRPLSLTELRVDRKALQLRDQHRVLHLHSLPRQPVTSSLQTACRLLLLISKYLKYSCRKLVLIFTENILSVHLLCFLPLWLYQCRPWGRSALQYFSGDCSHCRHSASSSEPGLPSLEQSPTSTVNAGGHGAHLPATHHCQ